MKIHSFLISLFFVATQTLYCSDYPGMIPGQRNRCTRSSQTQPPDIENFLMTALKALVQSEQQNNSNSDQGVVPQQQVVSPRQNDSDGDRIVPETQT